MSQRSQRPGSLHQFVRIALRLSRAPDRAQGYCGDCRLHVVGVPCSGANSAMGNIQRILFTFIPRTARRHLVTHAYVHST